jgi:small subunit ribosomal protein S28e
MAKPPVEKKEKTEEPQQQQQQQKKQTEFVSGEIVPAQILELVGSMGTREGGRQARVKLLSGREVGKIMRRNVIGPFKVGDVLMLRETEIEASPAKGRKR